MRSYTHFQQIGEQTHSTLGCDLVLTREERRRDPRPPRDPTLFARPLRTLPQTDFLASPSAMGPGLALGRDALICLRLGTAGAAFNITVPIGLGILPRDVTSLVATSTA